MTWQATKEAEDVVLGAIPINAQRRPLGVIFERDFRYVLSWHVLVAVEVIMSTIISENPAHQAAVTASETRRQADVAAAARLFNEFSESNTEYNAAVRAADMAHLRRCVESAIANRLSPEPWLSALRELGASIYE